MAKTTPWLKFYPSDWRADPGLRMCGYAARGLWIDILALMHEAEPYGHLMVNGRAPNARQLAGMLGGTEKEVSALLDELEEAGVFSRSEDGVIVSRRMVRDRARSEEGRKWIGKRWTGDDGPTGKPNRPPDSPPNSPPNRSGGSPPTGTPITQKPEARSQKLDKNHQQPESVAAREPPAPVVPPAADAAERKREINRIMDIGVRLCAVAGIDHEDPRWHGDFGCIAGWLASGADPDLDIVPAAEAVMAKRRRTDPKFVPKSLAYFREAVEEARQRRMSPAAMSGGSSAAPQRDRDGEFRVWMQFWREKQRWLGEGPPPDQPGCIVPDRIRNETLEGAA